MTQINIIERFEIEGRGTVFTCHLPTIKEYSEAATLKGQVFEHKGEKWEIREIEMFRGGIVDRPQHKQPFGLLVRKV